LNEMNGHRSCNIVNMALCALRLNRTLHFDPVAQSSSTTMPPIN
jgi:hypothetical protein